MGDANDGQGSANDVLALLRKMDEKLTSVQQDVAGLAEDVATLGDNDVKLNERLQALELAGGGMSPALATQQIEALQRQIEDVANRPEFVRTPDQIKAQYARALKRAGEVEREQDVRCFWYPEPDPAKRDVPLTTTVRGPRAAEDAKALGYLGSLDEAAAALAAQTVTQRDGAGKEKQVPRYASAKLARQALHEAAAKFARGQVASVPAAAAPVRTAAA